MEYLNLFEDILYMLWFRFIFEPRLAHNIIVISPIREYWLILSMQTPTRALVCISSLNLNAPSSLNELFIISQGLCFLDK